MWSQVHQPADFWQPKKLGIQIQRYSEKLQQMAMSHNLNMRVRIKLANGMLTRGLDCLCSTDKWQSVRQFNQQTVSIPALQRPYCMHMQYKSIQILVLTAAKEIILTMIHLRNTTKNCITEENYWQFARLRCGCYLCECESSRCDSQSVHWDRRKTQSCLYWLFQVTVMWKTTPRMECFIWVRYTTPEKKVGTQNTTEMVITCSDI